MNRLSRVLVPLACLGTLLLISERPTPASLQSKMARVVKVASNGDLHFADGQKLRLMGVDLPTTWQCQGDDTLEYMRAQLEGRIVSINVEKADLLGKSLAYVDAGGDVGADLILSGYGFALRSFRYSNEDRYKRAEETAKATKRGLWGRCEVTCGERGCETESRPFGCGR